MKKIYSYLLVSVLACFCIHSVLAQQSNIGVRTRSVTDTIIGAVGEIESDRLGNLFVASFQEKIWKVSPWGDVEVFHDGGYGASGNAMDKQGNLYQANIYGATIIKINRYTKEVTEVANEGLVGPVGLTFKKDDLYICDCNANYISKMGKDQKVVPFSKSPLFKCPNGITVGSDGNLYVVNYSNPNVVKIDNQGNATLFATLPATSGGHIIQYGPNFYITSFFDHKIFKVSLGGVITHFAGTGNPGIKNGSGLESQFYNPNGIAMANGRLFINDKIPATNKQPTRTVIREIAFTDFGRLMTRTMNAQGPTEIKKVYRDYKAHPSFKNDNVEPAANQMGYALLNQKKMENAIALFEMNTEFYPKSFNTWDSLAEAHLLNGDKKNAKKFYKKSLELNPQNTNAIDKLKGL